MACCLGSTLMSCCCSGGCGACSGGGKDEESGEGFDESPGAAPALIRVKYALFLLGAFILAVCLKNGLNIHSGWLVTDCGEVPDHPPPPPPSFFDLAEKAKEKFTIDPIKLCYGHGYVYRISFAMALFYFLHMIFTIDCGPGCGDSKVKHQLQSRFFCFKILIVILLLVVCLFIKNVAFFVIYARVCMVAGGIFILMQIVLIVDFAYEWNDYWMEKDEHEETPRYQYMLLCFSLVFYALGFTGIGLMYHWFGGGDCTLNGVFITITGVAGVGYTMAAIRLEHASILPASIVFVYTCFVCYSAIDSGSTAECNTLHPAGTASTGTVVVSSLFAIGSLVYSCMSVGGARGSFSLIKDRDEEDTAVDTSTDYNMGGYTFFHMVMVLGSMYMAMLLTSWSADDTDGGVQLNHSMAAMWVKISAQWLTILVYCWTLAAPIVLADRDFDF